MGRDSLETATFSCSSSISELSAKLSIEFGLESSSDTRSISILCGIATVRSPEKQVEKGQNPFLKLPPKIHMNVHTNLINKVLYTLLIQYTVQRRNRVII